MPDNCVKSALVRFFLVFDSISGDLKNYQGFSIVRYKSMSDYG